MEQSDKFKNAIDDVISGRKTYREAAALYEVSHSKIFRHFKQVSSSEKSGPKSLLNEEEQKTLQLHINECFKKGCPRRARDVIDAAHLLLKRRLGENCKKPSYTWLRNFLENQNMTLRKPEKITNSAGNLTEKNIKSWFLNTFLELQEQNASELLLDPSRIFNADETFVLQNPTRGNVASPKGAKNVYDIAQGNEKEGITAMCGYSADGKPLKPFLIFSYERIPKKLRETFPHDRAVLQSSKNGWMDSERCVVYLQEVAKEVKERGINLPEEKIIFFWDRYPAHMTIDVCQAAAVLGIILIGLYPNATFLIQPCDVAIFRSLKSHWNEVARKTKFNDMNKKISKDELPHLFLEAFNLVTEETIKSGFRATGIYPWDSEAIDYTKCLGKKQATSSAAATEMVADEDVVTMEENEAISIQKY
jgi:DDE superfamily endonuclease